MATKYLNSAQVGEVGIALVNQIVTEAGAIFRSFEKNDLGIDGHVELLTDKREPSGDLVLVQVKAGSSYIRGGRFYVNADKDHFETWARYSLPVVGIVCDPSSRTARWVDISEHLRKNPGAIANGPYAIEAPAAQPFSKVGFDAFLNRFRRSVEGATRVNITPNLLIREWNPYDAGPTEILLSSIALDYPDFKTWLYRKFNDKQASKKVVQVGAAVAGFSMWQKKDARNIKLQTFMVGSTFRGTAIGQHLLYHEIRTWAHDPLIERVHVTVSSNKVDLIAYFRMFGFRVEGFSPNRYPRTSNSAELVLAKHFVRKTVRSSVELKSLVDEISAKIWGIVPTAASRFGVVAEDFAVPAQVSALTVNLNNNPNTANPRIRLLDTTGNELARHDDVSFMTEFFPLRIHLLEKRFVLVPIYRHWADAMLSDSGPHTPLKLRIDNVYYCYPKVKKLVKGDLVVFYETKVGGGRGAAIGAAVLLEVAIDAPTQLYQRFSDLGVYTLSNVKEHENAQGQAMAIRFGLFEPFERTVSLARIRTILAKPKQSPQGLTPISRDGFEAIRTEGL